MCDKVGMEGMVFVINSFYIGFRGFELNDLPFIRNSFFLKTKPANCYVFGF